MPALSRAPPRNEEDHTHEAAYNTAIEQLNSQPKQWHPPGGTAEETIAICTTDNSQAVQDLQKQWDGKRLGIEGVKEQLGFEMAFNGKEFLDSGIDFTKFDSVKQV